MWSANFTIHLIFAILILFCVVYTTKCFFEKIFYWIMKRVLREEFNSIDGLKDSLNLRESIK